MNMLVVDAKGVVQNAHDSEYARLQDAFAAEIRKTDCPTPLSEALDYATGHAAKTLLKDTHNGVSKAPHFVRIIVNGVHHFLFTLVGNDAVKYPDTARSILDGTATRCRE